MPASAAQLKPFKWLIERVDANRNGMWRFLGRTGPNLVWTTATRSWALKFDSRAEAEAFMARHRVDAVATQYTWEV
jgi:hypothetical protein